MDVGGTCACGTGFSRGERGVGGDTCGDGVDGAGSLKVSVGGWGGGCPVSAVECKVGFSYAAFPTKLLLVASFVAVPVGRMASRLPCTGALDDVGGRPGVALDFFNFLAASTAMPLYSSWLASSPMFSLSHSSAPALLLPLRLICYYPVASPKT